MEFNSQKKEFDDRVNDSYFQKQESNFRNLGNLDFQSRKRQGLRMPIPPKSSSS